MGPLSQIDENLFTSSPSHRRFSASSGISCITNPSSPTSPQTPKSEGCSSLAELDESSFGDLSMRFQGSKLHCAPSIAPGLLSINSQEDLLQPHQIENIIQALPNPQPQCNQSSTIRCQGSIDPFMDYSQSFFWGPETSPGAAAMTALQCTRDEYEENYDMSSENSHHSSPSPELSYNYSLPQLRPNKLTLSTSEPPRPRRAPNRRVLEASPELETPPDVVLIVSNANKPHGCSVKGCLGRFKRQEHLRRHERTHTKERPYKCSIPRCGKRFSRTDNLRSHRRTHMKVGGRNEYIPGLEML